VVRTAPGLDPEALLEPARRLLQRVPAMAIEEVTTMDFVLAQAVGPARQVMLLLGLLTTLAVLLLVGLLSALLPAWRASRTPRGCCCGRPGRRRSWVKRSPSAASRSR